MKVQKLTLSLLFGLMAFNLSFSVPAFAQNENTAVWDAINKQWKPIERVYGGRPQDPRVIAALIIKVILSLVAMIYIVLIVYGGFLWMTASGNADQIAKAKSTILHGAIGVGIIFSAFAIARLFIVALGCAVDYTGQLCLFVNNLAY